jgi:flagellar biosynthesis GTPase FlhF
MSVIKAVDTLNPYAKSDKVLNINLDSQSDAYILSNLIYEAGTYVFAIWVKTDVNSTVNFKILGTDVSFEATDSWQLFTKRIDADSSNKSVEIKPQININSYFYEGFLSKGTTFTGWFPAPEDVDEDINNAQSSADKANTNASNAQQSANSAQNTANNASTKADQVKADAAAASSAAQKAKDQADKAQKDSDAAKALATNAWNDINDLEQVVIVDSSGVRVLESKNSKNYSHIKSDGMHVFNNGNDVAQFGQQSKMNNLAVKDYMMFGAHRAELSTINEEQGTAFYWIGDIQ